MSIYMVTVTGKSNDEDTARALIFVVEGQNEDDAIVKAGNLKRVRLLDSVSSITTEEM